MILTPVARKGEKWDEAKVRTSGSAEPPFMFGKSSTAGLKGQTWMGSSVVATGSGKRCHGYLKCQSSHLSRTPPSLLTRGDGRCSGRIFPQLLHDPGPSHINLRASTRGLGGFTWKRNFWWEISNNITGSLVFSQVNGKKNIPNRNNNRIMGIITFSSQCELELKAALCLLTHFCQHFRAWIFLCLPLTHLSPVLTF